MEPIIDFFRQRRSVRKFKPDPVPREYLDEMLEAAGYAPSGLNKQPWRYYVVLNPDVKHQMYLAVLKEIQEIEGLIKDNEYAEVLEPYKFFSTHFVDAPLVIGVAYRPQPSYLKFFLNLAGHEPKIDQEEKCDPTLQSIGASIQNLMLAAAARGLGTCWMSAPLLAKEPLEAIMEIKTPWQLAALVPVGYPCHEPVPVKRKPLEKYVRMIE